MPRRLVLLVDVSGSMSPYADALLCFGHAAVHRAPSRTEVFTIGTRLTRVTRALRLAIRTRRCARPASAIPDWHGGTRLAESLKAFLDRWGQRGMARGAVVVLCSDGWERGDAATARRGRCPAVPAGLPAGVGQSAPRQARISSHWPRE